MGFKDAHTLMNVMQDKASGELQDDKTYLMERVIQVCDEDHNKSHAGLRANLHWKLVAGLPTRSKARADLTNAFLDELWNSLQHPPLSYLGDKYQYRQADGS